jgi:cytochrome b pre-mRNA-processing protein 3
MLNVLDWLRKRSPTGRKAAKIYGSIVTQARQPAFYAALGIPDTVLGRYEMIVVHMFLALEKLHGEGAGAEPLRRALVEHFITDMDDSMRQLAVGDMAVPRRVKKAAAGLKERVERYCVAVNSGEPKEAMASVLGDVLADVADNEAPRTEVPDCVRIAVYVVESHDRSAIGPDGGLHGFAALPATV